MEFLGDALVLAVQDLGVSQVEHVLGDRSSLRAGVAGRQQVGRFVSDRELDVAVPAGEPQVGVEALHRLDPEPELFPRLVADHHPQVAGGGDLAHRPSPRVQAHQRHTDGLVAQGFQS